MRAHLRYQFWDVRDPGSVNKRRDLSHAFVENGRIRCISDACAEVKFENEMFIHLQHDRGVRSIGFVSSPTIRLFLALGIDQAILCPIKAKVDRILGSLEGLPDLWKY